MSAVNRPDASSPSEGMDASPRGDSALAFATRAWPVFPCDPKTKQPLTEHGVKDATTDVERIRAWWARWPQAMIGLPTGKSIGAFVVDFDPGVDEKTGEIFELTDLVKKLSIELGVIWPKTLAVVTPRGGRHAYFRLPEGDPPGNRAGIVKRIDVRGEGGYVIVPPSVRADGVAYRWAEGCAPDELELAIAPPALLDCIFRRGKWARDAARAADAGADREPARQTPVDVSAHVRTYALAALASEAGKVAGRGPGERNDKRNRAAFALGQLVAAGALLERVVRAELEDAADRCGLTKDDGLKSVRDTIDSGLKSARSSPRDLREIEAAAARRLASPGRRSSGAAVGRPAASPAPRPADVEPSQKEGLPDEFEQRRKRVRDRRLAELPLTDLGNAERFVKRFGDRFLWCAAIGWLAWDGRRWAIEAAEGMVDRAVHQTVKQIEAEAAAVRDSDDDYLIEIRKGEPFRWSDRIAGWALASQGASHLGCIPKLAAPYLEVQPKELDADPYKLNVANGTLVFRRGK